MLCDYFKGDFSKMLHLTPRQKLEVLGHKRDKKTGAIMWPNRKVGWFPEEGSKDTTDVAGATEPIEVSAPTGVRTPQDELKAAEGLAEILSALNPLARTQEQRQRMRNKIATELKAGLREKFGLPPEESK